MKRFCFNTIRVLMISAIISTLCFLNISNVYSATEETYRVTVSYHDCETGTFLQSRTETWRDGGGKIVYEENRDCNGEVTTTGNKPIVGKGKKLWDKAVDVSMLLDISVAGALSEEYQPILDSIIINNDGIKVGEYYQFKFPFDWVYDVAETSIFTIGDIVTITSDALVDVQIVNLLTGELLSNIISIPGLGNYSFNTAGLTSGCIYTVVVRQYIPKKNEVCIIRNHNFCK